nr:DUF2225 domain-containing protein [Cytobacillus firmus]
MQQLKPTYDKKCECRVCRQSFTTKKLRSRFVKAADYDSDFCPNYSDESMNPLLYHIHTCPLAATQNPRIFLLISRREPLI